MNIYIEEVFIENFVVNLSIVLLLYIFTKNKINIVKVIIIVTFLSVISIIKILNIGNNYILQILSLNIFIYFMFKDNKIISYLKHIVYLYIIYIEYIGIIIFLTMLFNINITNIFNRIILYLVTLYIAYFINNYMWKLWKNKLINDSLKYKVIFENYNICFNLMLDTGNFITDPCMKNEVIIISEKAYLKKIIKNNIIDNNLKKIEIDIRTVIGKSKLKGGIFKNITIIKNSKEKYKFNEIIVLFTEDEIYNNKFEGIIGYNTYLNKLGGVKL